MMTDKKRIKIEIMPNGRASVDPNDLFTRANEKLALRKLSTAARHKIAVSKKRRRQMTVGV